MTERLFCILCGLALLALGWLAGALYTWVQVLREARRR